MIVDTRFETLLHDRIGLDPASIGQASVQRAVEHRASKKTEGDLERYWQLLQVSPQEQQALIEAVVVPETWFFRYPESMALLAQRVQARLASRRDAMPLRIICLPCSTGEEPYSVAMALRDVGIGSTDVLIDALDISPVVIARAKAAVYGRNSFRTQSLAFRDRYFTPAPDTFVLSPSIRDAVTFRVENIFALSAQTTSQPYDIVFCRNLLIYFDPPTQVRALAALARLCRPDSELYVGPAEASLLTRSGYSPVGGHRTFAFHRKLAVVADSTLARGLPPSTLAAGMPARTADDGFSRAILSTAPVRVPRRLGAEASPGGERIRASALKKTMRPDVIAKPQVVAAVLPSGAAPTLAEVESLANLGQISLAQAAAQAVLARDGANADLFYLLGLCLDAQDDSAGAALHYRKALYLEPAHERALTHLAAILDARGEDTAAARLRQRAVRGKHHG